MQTAVKEALASAIARGVNPRGVHRARTVGASVRARRRVCSATDAEGGAAASAESRSEETRVARPPPLRTYYADWAEVILPEGHRFPMEKYQATRLMLEQDKSLSDIMELVPSPVRRGIPFQRGTATCTFERRPRRSPLSRPRTSNKHDLTAPSKIETPAESVAHRRARRARGGIRDPRPGVRAHGKGRPRHRISDDESLAGDALLGVHGRDRRRHARRPPPGHHRQVRRADRGRHPPRVQG